MKSLTLVWPGGEHEFLLRIAEERALEQQCNAGVNVIFLRLQQHLWGIDDVIGPLRLGLIGAGMKEVEAKRLVMRAHDTSPLYTLAIPALKVLEARILGSGEDDQPGKAEAGAADGTAGLRSQTAKPDGQPSTAPAPSSDSLRPPSIQ